MRPTRLLLLVLFLLGVGRFIARYTELPLRLASHFGADGQPNGWMSKSGFAAFTLIPLCVVAAVVFVGPLLMSRLPPDRISFPNKEHWLAAERRAETIDVFARYMDVFGAALLALLIFVYELVFDANVANAPLANGPFMLALCAFALFTVGWSVALVRRFGAP